MTSTTPTLQFASLHFREGNSDKDYHTAIDSACSDEQHRKMAAAESTVIPGKIRFFE